MIRPPRRRINLPAQVAKNVRILFTPWRLADLVRTLVSFVHFVHVFARDEPF
jgi:hypothetical protein